MIFMQFWSKGKEICYVWKKILIALEYEKCFFCLGKACGGYFGYEIGLFYEMMMRA
jgi:hypothetical protein